MTTIRQLTEGFIAALERIIQEEAGAKALAALERWATAPSAIERLAIGAPRKSVLVALRRKGPIQLCPVPGCKNRAAPVFGMVCAGHKDIPKAKIAKFREARRAAKAAA